MQTVVVIYWMEGKAKVGSQCRAEADTGQSTSQGRQRQRSRQHGVCGGERGLDEAGWDREVPFVHPDGPHPLAHGNCGSWITFLRTGDTE